MAPNTMISRAPYMIRSTSRPWRTSWIMPSYVFFFLQINFFTYQIIIDGVWKIRYSEKITINPNIIKFSGLLCKSINCCN
jgi:hypothetical protein